MSLLTNAAFGPYILREIVGGGGVAEVYRAEHREDHKPVAVKIMRPERLSDKAQVVNFASEQELMAELEHPCIPRVKRSGEIAGRPAFAMDFAQGTQIAHMVLKERKSPGLAALTQLASATAHLHAHKIVHADLKLENAIWGSPSRLWLVDYGNARRISLMGSLMNKFRKPAQVFGTAMYLAPEIAAGGQATCASDAFALGICAHLLLVGKPPFDGASQSARLKAHATENAYAINLRCRTLPPMAAQLIDACLDRDPSGRPLVADLELALRSALSAVKRTSDPLNPPQLDGGA